MNSLIRPGKRLSKRKHDEIWILRHCIFVFDRKALSAAKGLLRRLPQAMHSLTVEQPLAYRVSLLAPVDYLYPYHALQFEVSCKDLSW